MNNPGGHAKSAEKGQVCKQSDEHPSGLSGEHSVVLDAIHQECLHGG